MADISMREVKNFASAWQEAGLDDAAIGPVTAVLERNDDIGRQSRELKAAAEVGGKAIGREIADGSATLLEGIARHAALTSGSTPLGSATGFSRAFVLIDGAQRALLGDVARFFDKNGVVLITEHIQAAFDKLRSQVEKLAPKIAASADEATRGGIEGKIADLDRTRDLLVKAYRALRRCGCDVEVEGILADFGRLVTRLNADTEVEVPA
jgi:hypothetical protein